MIALHDRIAGVAEHTACCTDADECDSSSMICQTRQAITRYVEMKPGDRLDRDVKVPSCRPPGLGSFCCGVRVRLLTHMRG